MKIILFFTSLTFCSLSFSQSTMNYQKYIVHFDFGKSTLSNAELKKWEDFKSKSPSDYSINELKAHTDTVSSEEFNLRLAAKRLETVKILLALSKPTIETILGESQAKKASNYNAVDFRIVEINYLLIPKIIDEPIIDVQKTVLSQTIDQLLKDDNINTIQFDLSILFEPGLDIMLKSSNQELEDLKEIMTTNETLNIVIHGHVCCKSEPSLALNRAKAVYNYLITNGINASRMNYVGHDNNQPKISPELTDEDRITNRRVSIEFLKQ